jgi:membrane associated rhomboid family serine protease
LISVNYSLLLLLIAPIPYGVDKSAPLRRSPVTLLLVLTNLIIFIATHVGRHGVIDPIFEYGMYGLTPASVHPIQLVSYMFMHVSVAHVVWNMLFLALFGPAVEQRLGGLIYAALYFLGGMAAGLMHASMVMHFAANSSAAYEPMVGASGAISAVLGLFVVFAGRRSINLYWPMGALIGRGWHLLEVRSAVVVALWLAQTVFGAALSLLALNESGIAYFAHIGGFIFGVGCGLIGGLGSVANDKAVMNEAGAASAQAISPSNAPEPGSVANSGLVALLERAVDSGDYERAEPLYSKCRSVGMTVGPDLLERLSLLAEDRGLPDRAAELRAMGKQARV